MGASWAGVGGDRSGGGEVPHDGDDVLLLALHGAHDLPQRERLCCRAQGLDDGGCDPLVQAATHSPTHLLPAPFELAFEGFGGDLSEVNSHVSHDTGHGDHASLMPCRTFAGGVGVG
jgi:hypothetical protein